MSFPAHPEGTVRAMALGTSPDGSTLLAIGSIDGTVRVRDLSSGRYVHTVTGHRGALRAMAFGTWPDRSLLLASVSEDGAVRLWDPIAGRHLRTLTDDPPGVARVAFATLPTGATLLATGGIDGTVRVWDPATGKRLRTLAGSTGFVASVAFGTLPDATTILASASIGSLTRTVRVWDPATGEQLPPLTAPTTLADSVDCATVSDVTVPDATVPGATTVLAAGSEDGTIRLWDSITGQPLHTLTGHQRAAPSVVFATPPGEPPVLVSGGQDGTVRVWDPVTGRRLRTMQEPGPVDLVAAAPAASQHLRVAAAGRGFLDVWTVRLRESAQAPRRAGSSRVQPSLPVESSLRASAAGLIGLASAGLNPPLGLLADLIAITGGDPPSNALLRPLAEHHGVHRLRGLTWPRAARVGLAALLIDDLPADPRYLAPPAVPQHLHTALLAALASPPTSAEPGQVPVSGLRTAADRVSDQILTLLAVVGPDAVAADPVLPLRLRSRAHELPPLGRRHRALLAETTRYAQRRVSAQAGSSRMAAGTTGLSRRGSITSLLHTQLAWPADLFTYRYACGDLLYRLHDGDVEPLLDSVTIVLDTTPPTFGPVETVLRLVAHTITVTLWAAHQHAHLICVDAPDRVLTLARPADLVTIWSSRTLDPPALSDALATAARQRTTTTIVLTHHHLAHEHPLVPSAALRTLTTHPPGDPPTRPVASPFHLHLPPQPSPAALTRAVLRLLAPAPPATGTVAR